MFEVRKSWVMAFTALFFLHGVLYYLYPAQHYTAGGGTAGWIAYIKYICLLGGLTGLLSFRFNLRKLAWFSVGSTILMVAFGIQFYWISSGNVLLVQFSIPIFAFFFAPFLVSTFDTRRKILWSILMVMSFTVVVILAEIFLGQSITTFGRGGFRGVGPFVNPNNTGLVIALLGATYHLTERRLTPNLLVGLMIGVVILLTGSKTALVVYLVAIFMAFPSLWRLPLIALFAALFVLGFDKIVAFIALLELREPSLQSAVIRSSDFGQLIGLLNEVPLRDLLFGFSKVSIVDNAYLDILSFGGVTLLFTFIVIQVGAVWLCLVNKRRKLLALHFLFVLAMLTTNVPRLWPIGYMYWALIGISFLGTSQLMRSVRVLRIAPYVSRERYV